jgi:type IV pilus assembly protein PilB
MTINTPEVNIMTAEDPVEYDLDGINQVQVNPQIGFRFSDALRAFLRQDPDVILVGEIRDTETAEIAVEAALTGHLLFSTLHTNSAAETITRLEEMGVERYLISSSLILIVAQRLARKICPYCKKEVKVKPEVLIELGVPPEKAQELVETKKFYKGTGCPKCDGSGYKGRVGLYEVMEITPKIREMIIEGKSALEISRQAQKEGMRTLRQMGILKVLKGETTPEEVMRVTR